MSWPNIVTLNVTCNRCEDAETAVVEERAMVAHRIGQRTSGKEWSGKDLVRK